MYEIEAFGQLDVPSTASETARMQLQLPWVGRLLVSRLWPV